MYISPVHPTQLPVWQALIAEQKIMAQTSIQECVANCAQQNNVHQLRLDAGITLDYSRHALRAQTLNFLLNLAENMQLRQAIQALFLGESLNSSECKEALHPLLRTAPELNALPASLELHKEIVIENQKLADFVERIHTGLHKSLCEESFTDVVVIGIGGSFAGPKFAIDVFKDLAVSNLKFHFIVTPDDDQHKDVLNAINPKTTLFIVSSKSFTTLETQSNFYVILNWMTQQLNKTAEDILHNHFIAITANMEKAKTAGFKEKNIFRLWNTIGGRYSIWSAIGLPIRLMIGNKAFEDFLNGAAMADAHFKTAEFANNLPVIMALISIWYTNFWDTAAEAVIPYSHRLRYLIPYLQQLVMESNGKSVSQDGKFIDYKTSPIIFGEEGNVGQHAYHQLLHQGNHLIPIDFLIVQSTASLSSTMLMASCLGQATALAKGNDFQNKTAESIATYQVIPGNRPSNLFILDDLSPFTIGALLALYEHKTFAQAIIWNINPFDQWGVELGKEITQNHTLIKEKNPFCS